MIYFKINDVDYSDFSESIYNFQSEYRDLIIEGIYNESNYLLVDGTFTKQDALEMAKLMDALKESQAPLIEKSINTLKKIQYDAESSYQITSAYYEEFESGKSNKDKESEIKTTKVKLDIATKLLQRNNSLHKSLGKAIMALYSDAIRMNGIISRG